MKAVSKQITIDDVAKKAGVSTATVSRVLNGNTSVRGPARVAVEQTVSALQFVPNHNARRLSLGRTFALAAIVPFYYRPSFMERLRGVHSVLGTTPYELIVYNIDTVEKRDSMFMQIPRSDRVDGVIVFSMRLEERHVRMFANSGVPIVLADAEHARIPSVHEDSVYGGYIATRHLLELGHRRIAYLCDPLDDAFSRIASHSSYYRLLGYQKALKEAGIEFDKALFSQGEHGRVVGRLLTMNMLQQANPPTAIFAASDTQALGILEAARALKLDVPGDLSVVGYDDIEIAEVIGLTTINQSLFESGQLAAQMLLSRLAAEAEAIAPTSVQVPIELVVRTTTAPPRATHGR